MVALLVGAIRTESEHTLDPVQILSRVNRSFHLPRTCETWGQSNTPLA